MCRSMEEMRNETKTETLITLVSRYMAAHGCGFDDSCSSLGLTSAEKDAVAAYVFGKKTGLDTIPCV